MVAAAVSPMWRRREGTAVDCHGDRGNNWQYTERQTDQWSSLQGDRGSSCRAYWEVEGGMS
jgi:hypothetical protein